MGKYSDLTDHAAGQLSHLSQRQWTLFCFTVRHEILRILGFAIIAVFSMIRQNRFPREKFPAKDFSALRAKLLELCSTEWSCQCNIVNVIPYIGLKIWTKNKNVCRQVFMAILRQIEIAVYEASVISGNAFFPFFHRYFCSVRKSTKNGKSVIPGLKKWNCKSFYK